MATVSPTNAANGTGENAGKPSSTSLDANVYATKKTIAQGLLDVALLTANASQLKYLIQAGKEHEFYYVMMTLISLSIILQMCLGSVLIIKGRTDINDPNQQKRAERLNDAAVWLVFTSTVLTGCMMLLIANTNLNEVKKQRRADNLNNAITIGVFLVAILNILISALGIKNSDDWQSFRLSAEHLLNAAQQR
ncbi:Ninjurin-2 like protein [Argiope bruennichi]|uniref:Ninjurin-2 like protein n=1 Tax=Argiope bruennichi TaxID=94029 RepID=A0A8T0FY04_ARGBR|nr:Ninjurin-2 like protein [Argiope bruennichi]